MVCSVAPLAMWLVWMRNNRHWSDWAFEVFNCLWYSIWSIPLAEVVHLALVLRPLQKPSSTFLHLNLLLPEVTSFQVTPLWEFLSPSFCCLALIIGPFIHLKSWGHFLSSLWSQLSLIQKNLLFFSSNFLSWHHLIRKQLTQPYGKAPDFNIIWV